MLQKVKAVELGFKGRGFYYLDYCSVCGAPRYVQGRRSIGRHLCKPCAEKQKRQKYFEQKNGKGLLVKRADELGLKGKSYYYLDECPQCHTNVWRTNKYLGSLCRKCAANNRNTKGSNNPRWKGGISITQGYRMVTLMPDDPYVAMANISRRVFEHRLVMARHLGRILEGWEVVHHINANRLDNRIENLELLPNKEQNQMYARVHALEDEVKELRKITRLLLWHIQQGNLELNQEDNPVNVQRLYTSRP